MKRKTTICITCNCKISKSNYTKHVATCKGKPRPAIRRRNNLPAPVYISREQRSYRLNWNFAAIQEFYNNGKTIRDICEEFNISTGTLYKAVKDGLLKTRSGTETKKMRGTLKGVYTEESWRRKCEGGRVGGCRSAYIQRIQRRSKHEIYFAALCAQYFDNVLCNEPMFNGWDADIILPDYKLAIHWNGNVHYLPIFGEKNLHAVQVRDKIKHNAIERNGYKNYIIVDRLTKFNQKFVEEQFAILTKSIIITHSNRDPGAEPGRSTTFKTI